MIQNLLGTTEVSPMEQLAVGIALCIIGLALCVGMWIALKGLARWVWNGSGLGDEEDEL